MSALSIDFETFSPVDLPTCGLYNYVAHPDFDIICASYRLPGGDFKTWWPGEPLPAIFLQAQWVNAWNAAFERLVWNSPAARRYGFPPRSLEFFHCTAARARAIGVPGKLEHAARFLELELNKDFEGLSILKRYWAPDKEGRRLVPLPGSAVRGAIQRYCERDVALEDEIGGLLPPLPDTERSLYLMNELVNDRGIPVDMALVNAGLKKKDEAERTFARELELLTIGAIDSPKQTQRILDFLAECGVALADLTEESVAAALEDPDLPLIAEKILRIRADGAFAAISKYEAVAARVSADRRLRGAFVYCGAPGSGRFASYGVQFHNMRRDVPQNYEQVVRRALEGAASYSELASIVRCMFTGGFQIGDYSQIEARVLPWLARDRGAASRLDLFAVGGDLYADTAAELFACSTAAVDEGMRQLGKIVELACGFQGGARAIRKTARTFGIALSEKQSESFKTRWREAEPWAPRLWRGLEAAAQSALLEGRAHYGRVDFEASGSMLTMILPSGRRLWYHGAAFTTEEGRHGVELQAQWAARAPKRNAREWPRRALYGGLLAENATQAAARDILAHALRKPLSVVAHMHDEVAVPFEVPRETLEAAMLDLPDWAETLPLAVKVKTTARYAK